MRRAHRFCSATCFCLFATSFCLSAKVALSQSIGPVRIAAAPISTEYNAELQIGLVADNASESIATANTVRLTHALNAMWAGGIFTFADGSTGPVLKQIRFPAKSFFFKGTIETSARIGGALVGAGRGYEMSEEHFGPNGVLGGATSRLIRIDGENGGAVLRLRGSGFLVQGLELFGRRWITKSKATGTKTPSLIEVEGRLRQPTGRHIIRDCGLYEGSVGIRTLKGYYDNGSLMEDENHADNSSVENVEFFAVDSCFRSENQQAVNWTFRNIVDNERGGGESVVFDIARGGNIYADGVYLNHNKVTLIKVRDFSPNNNRIEVRGIRWDTCNAPTDYLTLFQYAGKPFPDSRGLRWSVRISGHIANTPTPTYDTSKLIQIPIGAVGFPKGDLQFDVTNLPPSGFASATSICKVPK
jgi:hypothetical protein